MRRLRCQTFGFTLLELLLVIGLTAFLGLMGLLLGQHWFAAQKQRLLPGMLVQALDFARQAALAQGQSVTLCAAASDQSCGQNWSQGILIFTDPNNTGRPNTAGLLLRVPPLLKTNQLIWRGWLGVATIRFAADGLPHGYHGSFYLVHDHTEQVVLVMNALGRIRLGG